jgi:hypothetical protein
MTQIQTMLVEDQYHLCSAAFDHLPSISASILDHLLSISAILNHLLSISATRVPVPQMTHFLRWNQVQIVFLPGPTAHS